MPAFDPSTPSCRVASPVRRWTRAALDGLWPPRCVLCQSAGAALCAPCRTDARRGLAHRCDRCAIPLASDAAAVLCGRCLQRRPAYDATIAAALFEAPFDQLVRGLKYGATLAYAPLFARMLMAERALPAFAGIHLLVPVPLSRTRMRVRGFNQAIEIAHSLARASGRPLERDAVLRIIDTAPQASLPFDARRRNVRDAFAVVDARRDRIAGRCVGVVDDVMTTGATLDELARTLKRAGAVSVVNLVVARTP